MRWLPDMDLNHDKQIQSLLCYRYTIGQTSVPRVDVPSQESSAANCPAPDRGSMSRSEPQQDKEDGCGSSAAFALPGLLRVVDPRSGGARLREPQHATSLKTQTFCNPSRSSSAQLLRVVDPRSGGARLRQPQQARPLKIQTFCNPSRSGSAQLLRVVDPRSGGARLREPQHATSLKTQTFCNPSRSGSAQLLRVVDPRSALWGNSQARHRKPTLTLTTA